MGSIGRATIKPNFPGSGRAAAWIGRTAGQAERVVRRSRGGRQGFGGLTWIRPALSCMRRCLSRPALVARSRIHGDQPGRIPAESDRGSRTRDLEPGGGSGGPLELATGPSGKRPKPCALHWRSRTTSSSPCPTQARPSGTWRIPPGSSRRSSWPRYGRAPGPWTQQYSYLFNSYYNAVGERISRDRRGLLSRPTVAEVFRYRAAIDERVKDFLEAGQRGSARPGPEHVHPGPAP